MENSIEFQFRDLPACSAVPQRTAPPRAPKKTMLNKNVYKKNYLTCSHPKVLWVDNPHKHFLYQHEIFFTWINQNLLIRVTIATLSIQDKITETVYELPVNIINNIFIIILKVSIYTNNPQAPNNTLSFLHW
jgi:hypothetical protein